MLARLTLTDPRHPDYKFKRLIVKPWGGLEPHRARRLEHLAARLHSNLGRTWDIRLLDGAYRVLPASEESAAATDAVALFAPWKELDLLVGFPADHPGAFDAAAELSPKVLGLWAADPSHHWYCVIVPDEGQEDEIVLAVHDFVQHHIVIDPAKSNAPTKRPGADAPGPSTKLSEPGTGRISPRRAPP